MRSIVSSALSARVRALGVSVISASIGLMAALVVVGCDKSETAAPPAAPTAGQPQTAGTVPPTPVAEPTPTAGTAAGAATAAVDVAVAETSCTDLTTKVCAEAGDTSEECTSIKVSAGLMSKKACAVALADLGDLKAKMAEAKKSCTDLANKLCADLGETTQTCAMVREKTPSFPVAQCNEMLGKYDSVIADLKKMEAANQPLTPEQQAKLAAGDAPSWGPADAKVVVVEFSDFQCPYCSRAAEAEKALKAKYEGSGAVRFIFRQFPLSFHQEAMPAAVASLEAHAQGKFWEYHDLLFQNQKNLNRETFERIAGEAGLDVAAVKAALDENRRKEQAEADMKLGEEVGVQGTPSMFVGGQRVQNPGDVDAISKMIDEQLAKAAAPQ